MILQNNLEQTTNLTDVIDHSTDIFENGKNVIIFKNLPTINFFCQKWENRHNIA